MYGEKCPRAVLVDEWEYEWIFIYLQTTVSVNKSVADIVYKLIIYNLYLRKQYYGHQSIFREFCRQTNKKKSESHSS